MVPLAATIGIPELVILLVILIGPAAACGTIASTKGRNVPLFVVLGFVLSLIGVVIALVVPSRAQGDVAAQPR